jgi:hypothetical protein
MTTLELMAGRFAIVFQFTELRWALLEAYFQDAVIRN